MATGNARPYSSHKVVMTYLLDYSIFNIALLSITLYLVATNMMLLAAGWRSLPSQSAGNFFTICKCGFASTFHTPGAFLVGATLLGTSSLSTLGVVGVVIEVFSLNCAIPEKCSLIIIDRWW